ncbi:Molybdate metabolism regulator [Escherichia coli]
MDKELPWLADNAQLELKYKKGKTPLSHRNWPGEPVPVITENIIQTLGDELLQKAEKKKNIVWRYENFSLEWQSAITQAINLIGEHKPSITARTMAALACIAQNDSQQLLDEIVQQEGLEYATEVVIARQFIVRCYESDPLVVTLQYQNEDYGYRSETYNEFDLRLRKHLSLAEESCWQRCADKLIAALPGITKVRRPFIALNLPEKPEIANELVSLECSQTHFRSKEWLKVVADDPKAVKELARYWSQDIFSDREASYMSHENHFGYAACAALLREQGLAAVPRLAMYAHKEDCGSLLVQINHPQVIRTLLLVADKNKPSLQRVAKYSKNFPHATLAALAELRALKAPPARPGYPIIEDKKLPAQQKARDEYWHTLLQTLMASQPQLAEEVMPWLSTQAQAVVNSYLSAPLKPVIDSTDNSCLPEILVSPSWRSKKKMTAPRLDLASLELTPQVYWQPGERERLAATESARYFSTGSFTERMERKSGRVVLQELGLGDDVWLFRNYILPGKLDAARKSLVVQWHYSPRRVEEINNGWHSTEAKSAEQALRSGDVEALINIWENDSYSHYRQEKSVWNLYLLAQLPREMALTFWLRINEKKHLFAGEDYFLSILGLDTLPGLLLAFSHHPKQTFPLILNFGATELALPVARVWRRFAARRDLARQWILQWPEHTATALIPLVFTKPSDNSEAALLALRLLYEQGHGELLQTVANRWQRTDVWPALEQLLKLGPIEIYPARIPKAPDFWHPVMWSRPCLIKNNQPVTDDALEIIGEMLRFTQGGRFYSGLEQLKTFCQPQTLAAFAWDLFVTNGAIVIHTQRLKSDPGGNLLS